MGKTIEIPLPNGFTVSIHQSEVAITVGLINSNGYTVSDRILTDESAEWLRKVVAKEEQQI